jgi:colicin import membrane protein
MVLTETELSKPETEQTACASGAAPAAAAAAAADEAVAEETLDQRISQAEKERERLRSTLKNREQGKRTSEQRKADLTKVQCVNAAKAALQRHEQRLAALRREKMQSEMQTDIAEVKTGVANIATDVGTIKDTTQDIDERLKGKYRLPDDDQTKAERLGEIRIQQRLLQNEANALKDKGNAERTALEVADENAAAVQRVKEEKEAAKKAAADARKAASADKKAAQDTVKTAKGALDDAAKARDKAILALQKARVEDFEAAQNRVTQANEDVMRLTAELQAAKDAVPAAAPKAEAKAKSKAKAKARAAGQQSLLPAASTAEEQQPAA